MACETCGGKVAADTATTASDQYFDPAGRTRRLGIDDLLAIFFNPPPSSGLTLPEGVPAPEAWPAGFPLLLAVGIVGAVLYAGSKHKV